MRTKDTLIAFEDELAVLLQYLYMDPDASIRVRNAVTTMEIRMTDSCGFLAKNLQFPDLPEMNYTSEMTVPVMFGIIEQLKQNPPEQYPKRFKNRWEEIKDLTLINMSLNKVNRR